jgi:hypothetical protein
MRGLAARPGTSIVVGGLPTWCLLQVTGTGNGAYLPPPSGSRTGSCTYGDRRVDLVLDRYLTGRFHVSSQSARQRPAEVAGPRV